MNCGTAKSVRYLSDETCTVSPMPKPTGIRTSDPYASQLYVAPTTGQPEKDRRGNSTAARAPSECRPEPLYPYEALSDQGPRKFVLIAPPIELLTHTFVYCASTPN